MVQAADRMPQAEQGQLARQVTILDIVLTQDKLLQGQLVDRGGVPRPKATVTLSSGDRVVAETVTNDQGIFAFKVPNVGVYALSDGRTSALVRAWTKRAAPPFATPGILMVSDGNMARGQAGGSGVATAIGVAAFVGATAAVVATTALKDDAS